VLSRGLVDVYRRFRGTCCLHQHFYQTTRRYKQNNNIFSHGHQNVTSNTMLSINQSASTSSNCVRRFRFFDETICTHFLSIARVLRQVSHWKAKNLNAAYGVSTRSFWLFASLNHSLTDWLTCTMTLSRADLEFCAARALFLHHAAPMVTVCPASGECSGSNLFTLLGTVTQSKLRQLSHYSERWRTKWWCEWNGEEMKVRKESDWKGMRRTKRKSVWNEIRQESGGEWSELTL
jgi:hypothetical protein